MGGTDIEALKRQLTNFAALGGERAFADYRVIDQHYDIQRSRWNIDPADLPMTLLSKGQLDMIERAVRRLERRGVAGDFIEAGVWRGGAVALMRALLRELGDEQRRVVAADSFAGIPYSTSFRLDPVDSWRDRWAASLDDVQNNLARLSLLDERIELLPGLFADTLSSLADRTFALVRLDADSLESTLTALRHLYPLVPRDGVVIIDDWHLPGCQAAVLAFVARHRLQVRFNESYGNCYWFKREERLVPPLPELPSLAVPA